MASIRDREELRKKMEFFQQHNNLVIRNNNDTVIKNVIGDMGEPVTMNLHLQQDGDIILEMINWKYDPSRRTTLKFTNPLGGGMTNVLVHKHLKALIDDLKENGTPYEEYLEKMKEEGKR